jgi:transposase
MKPYSRDFRRKIVETKQKTQDSNQQIAARFQVSYSFVRRLLKRYESTGSVEPSPHGGGKALKLNSQQIDVVTQLVEEDNDATLQQLCERTEEKTGLKVSVPTMCRLLQRLELTQKKRPFTRVKQTLFGCKSSERNIGQSLERLSLTI